jgi:hypothetical protein
LLKIWCVFHIWIAIGANALISSGQASHFLNLFLIYVSCCILKLFGLWVICIWNIGDELPGVLEVGDNLTINATNGNTEGVSFDLILCTKTFHKVRKTFTNHWGTSFDEGDDVVAGTYY